MGYRDSPAEEEGVNTEVNYNEMARSLRDPDLFAKLSSEKESKCKKIVSDTGAVQSAHPYSNGEHWCIRIVTGCEQIDYRFESLELDDCKADELTFEFDNQSVTVCDALRGSLETSTFNVKFSTDDNGIAHGFDFSWSCVDSTTISTPTTSMPTTRTTPEPATLSFTALASIDLAELQKAHKINEPADFADAAGAAVNQIFQVDGASAQLTERVTHANKKLIRLVQQIAKGNDRRGKQRDCVKADQWGQANLNALVDLNLTVGKLRRLMASYIDHRFVSFPLFQVSTQFQIRKLSTLGQVGEEACGDAVS